MENLEFRTFLITDDKAESYFVGRITRPQDQVKPEVWRLNIGDCLKLTESRSLIREA